MTTQEKFAEKLLQHIKEKHNFNKKWIRACKRVLKDNGTIWISGTMHNIYSIGMALEEEGFKIINNITWKKLNPPPNISCRAFVHSTETVLWAKKDVSKAKHKFNYEVMKKLNDNKQMKDVWETSLTKPSEKKCGKHPTQKPIELLEKIILASTDENDLILDPFNGSGTTGIVANRLKRKYIGIEKGRAPYSFAATAVMRITSPAPISPLCSSDKFSAKTSVMKVLETPPLELNSTIIFESLTNHCSVLVRTQFSDLEPSISYLKFLECLNI